MVAPPLCAQPAADPLCQVIGCLQSEGALPAIWFILSRAGCDAAALQAGAAGQFTSADEVAAIQRELDELRCALLGWWAVCV